MGASSYKATVMLFMSGGADTFNLLVPYEGTLRSEYLAVRADIALQNHELLEITTAGQAISKFAVHHKLPFLRDLYNDGNAAFMSNLGALVEPMTKDDFKSGTAEKCVGLFSHADQQAAAATLKCQVAGTAPKGNGGRIGDALSSDGLRVASFSLSGGSTWSQGFSTNTEVIHRKHGAVRLDQFGVLEHVIGNITQQTYNQIYAEEYVKGF